MGFGTLVVLVLAGLSGPLLGSLGRGVVPVAVGEIAAGVIAGPAVIGVLHPGQGALPFLAEVGFAMLMLAVGMHLPLRERSLTQAVRGGSEMAVIVFALAVPAGLLASLLAGGAFGLYAVVLASGSAAVLVPALQERSLAGADALAVIVQVTIADVATIVAVPLVVEPSRAGHAALGALLVGASALVLLLAARLLDRVREGAWVHGLRARSKHRGWALDLRLSLLALFLLAWVATRSGTSVLFAGFSAGVVVALMGGPKRLSTQVRGIADGFFVPLYFVVLGARLDVGGLFSHPSMLALAALLAALTALLRLAAAVICGRSRAGALAACAQLGVPAAVASLGLSTHALSAVVATAILAAGLLSLAISSAGIELLAQRERRAGERRDQDAAAVGPGATNATSDGASSAGMGTPAAA